MFSIKRIFKPNYERYDGVRPINIYLLRLLFLLVVVFVGWLVIVAYPLWSRNQLAGSPAEEMTYAFLWVILPIVAMPWTYAFKNYVWPRKIKESQAG